MKGICHLCNTNRELRESHIIPSFIFKWLKETSGTGFIRFGQIPNLRTQEGYKLHWFCDDCESLFNTWETEFANSIFYPMTKGGSLSYSYGPWLLRFAVSVSWRVLTYFVEELDLSHYPIILREKANNALSHWRDVLLEKTPHPSVFEQHMLPFDKVESFNYPDMPTNINRYILRTVDIDAVHSGDKSAFVYSKMGRIVLIGFIEMPNPRQWKGTKLHVKNGVLGSKHYTLPAGFGDYFINKAKRLAKLEKSISAKQQRKIEESYSKDLDRAERSETIKAMDQDVKLFGNKAFVRNE